MQELADRLSDQILSSHFEQTSELVRSGIHVATLWSSSGSNTYFPKDEKFDRRPTAASLVLLTEVLTRLEPR